MARTISLLAASVAAILLTVGVGCRPSGSGVAPEVLAQHRARLTLSEEPDDVQTVLEVREELLRQSGQLHDDEPDEHEDAHEEDAHEEGHDEHAEHQHAHEEPADVKATEPMEVALVGSVGGLANPWEETQPEYPFVKGEATFFLADLGEVAEVEASGHVHAPGEECAFCEAHASESSAMLAMVRFHNQQGEALAIEAPQLFALQGRDIVVVRGSARLVDGGMMVVDATGIYVRR